MNKQKLVYLILVTFVLTFLFLNGCEKKADTTIKVGAVIALTGYGGMFGESESNAIEMLTEKYQDKKIEFFIEDNKSNPKDGIAATNKLLNIHNVDIIFCDLSTVANAINSILAEKKKIFLASVYLSDLLNNNKYAIRNLPRGLDEAKLLLQYLSDKETDLNKTAILVSNDEFGNSSAQDFKEVLENFGGNTIYEGIIPEPTLIKSEIAKLLTNNLEVVYLGSILPHVGNAIKELRNQGYEGEIITNDAFAYSYIHDAAGQYAKNTIYVDFPESQSFNNFNNAYKNKFNKELVPTAILCYDGLSFLIDNWMELHKNNLDEFLNEINNKEYNGTYGKMKLINREIIYPLTVKVW